MTGSAMTGSATAGSATTGSATAGSAMTGSAMTGSATAGSATAGSAMTGASGTAGMTGTGGSQSGVPLQDAGMSPSTDAGGSGGADGAMLAGQEGPCDVYMAAGTPCVAAHSTVRALYGAYGGKLYQVRRSDNATLDIATQATGGFADTAAQNTFCANSTCVIAFVYDQSGHTNDLAYQGSTIVPGSPQSTPAVATTEQLMVGGHSVYSLYIMPNNSYWHDGSQSGVPTGQEPEGLYMVTSGTHYNAGCCFDYGNSETDRKADGAGAMDAINFGNECWFASTAPCTGSGPWVQADLEYGLFAGGGTATNPDNVPMKSKYVTAMLKNNGTTEFALKGGDVQAGGLITLYKGKLPNGYSPMKKQGAIVLGSGGDCCKPSGGANQSAGTFYEGAVVAGYPTDATDDAIQANLVAANYGK
jgi:hypothetical protein